MHIRSIKIWVLCKPSGECHMQKSIAFDLCVAEQLHCSLHVKKLKVTTTELEGQAGN